MRSTKSGIPRPIPDEEADERRYDPEAYLNEEDGVNASRSGKYFADAKMEEAVWERINVYPEALRTHQHRAKAYIPEKVARALAVEPKLIQRAVEGFYVRDPSQLRVSLLRQLPCDLCGATDSQAAARMTHFPPDRAVLSPVIMTRAAFAQLQGQAFHPPRVFGPEWHVREGSELDDERRWRELGVKIATGFEIMYREGGKKGRSGGVSLPRALCAGALALGDIDADDRSQTLQQESRTLRIASTLMISRKLGSSAMSSRAVRSGRNERRRRGEGGGKSELRSEYTHFTISHNADNSASAARPSFAYLVDHAVEEAASLPGSVLQPPSDFVEDSDSWLEVSPDELDSMMQRASGVSQAAQGGSGEKVELGEEHGEALGDLAKKVQEFVGGQGDIEGARFVE